MSAKETQGGGYSGDSIWTSDTRGGGDSGDSARKHVECHRDAVCSPAGATPCADHYLTVRVPFLETLSDEDFAHRAYDVHAQWNHPRPHARYKTPSLRW